MLPQAVMTEVRPAQARFSGPGLVEEREGGEGGVEVRSRLWLTETRWFVYGGSAGS